MPSGQPRETYDHAQPQNSDRAQAHPRDIDDDENELQEYENFFDQGH